ncbi:PP2C family protein-serine/threonine phosphatase [Lacisediminihabitans changchengi]|uniref:PP2C family protein-serine/threonine phosphatase n=1 Tax=Lacisediminihabitans changchengi TaxID=2787634 RepID=UPI001F1BC195|nr:protein phosphatase 2C domain-containing protein [Lacisediminihabitans changchengi]
MAWAAATDVGLRRKLNEDSYIAESPIFAVADGMGGHSAGDVASAAVVNRLALALGADFIEPAAIELALHDATEDIARAAEDLPLGVGTTVTGAALTLHEGEPYWVVFNVGDSRVYAIELDSGERPGTLGALVQVTVDHSVVQELVAAGLIRPEDAESHPESNVITRAVGFNAEPRIDFWAVPARTGLRLLLCSDGLSKELDDPQISGLLTHGLNPADTAAALVAAALDSGGRDNVTAVVVDVVASDGDFELDDTTPRAGRRRSE